MLKIGDAGGVDQVEVHAIVIEAGDIRIEGMLVAFFNRVVIHGGRAPLDGARLAFCACFDQQCLGERGFACSGMTY